LGMTTLGAIRAAGRTPSTRLEEWIVAGAVIVGGSFTATGQGPVFIEVEAVLTPLLLFSSVQVVLVSARGPRQRAMVLLGGAMTLFATISSADVLVLFSDPTHGPFSKVIWTLSSSLGYGDAGVLLVLGAAVIVVIVQDSFLDAEGARTEQLRT